MVCVELQACSPLRRAVVRFLFSCHWPRFHPVSPTTFNIHVRGYRYVPLSSLLTLSQHLNLFAKHVRIESRHTSMADQPRRVRDESLATQKRRK